MQFNSTKYGYIHNLQGDVIGLIDTGCIEVVKYVYNAWGKILSPTGSLASTLGAIQPFRYRSYVYDQETGLYYLRSRYYNPTWQRFINADCLLNWNVFSYCNSNPIKNSDFTGKKAVAIDASFGGQNYLIGKPKSFFDLGAMLGDPSMNGRIYELVNYCQRTTILNEKEAAELDWRSKLAQSPYDIISTLAEKLLEAYIGKYIKLPKPYTNYYNAYGRLEDIDFLSNYLLNDWIPKGIYHTTAALYYCEEVDNYILYSNTTSDNDSVLCYESIKGIYLETLDWDKELTLNVSNRGFQ